MPKVDVIDLTGGSQVLEGHLHEDDEFLTIDCGFLDEKGMGRREHVQRNVGNGAEAAALDEDGLFVEDLGGLDDFAIGGEHGGAGEAVLDELEGHEAIVDLLEAGAGEFNHVDLDALGSEAVDKRCDEGALAVEIKGGVNEIDADDAEGLLLLVIFLIEHANVDEDLGGLGAGLGLEANAHPTVGFAGLEMAARGDGIGEYEEACGIAAPGFEAFEHELVLVLEHDLEALAADVAIAVAVDGVADDHVIGGDALGDGAGGATDAEEPAGDFLACADLGEGAVFAGVEVDAEGLLVSIVEFGVHAGEEIGGNVAGTGEN